MPYANEKKQREYQKKWMRDYRKRKKEERKRLVEKVESAANSHLHGQHPLLWTQNAFDFSYAFKEKKKNE